MQVDYSVGITVLSFCMPVVFLLAAFYAIGISNGIAWWRVITAGILCGSAICGMHYLGNASIRNYECIYNKIYIVGAAIIAVVASTVALAMFFILQSLSGGTWWKRTISAFVLAGAVSSMHWCASVGTEYRLVRLRRVQESSRTATVVAVICLVRLLVANLPPAGQLTWTVFWCLYHHCWISYPPSSNPKASRSPCPANRTGCYCFR